MKIITYLFSIFFISSGFSQTFESIIAINNLTTPTCAIECTNGYIIGVAERSSENSPNQTQILKIDTKGKVVKKLELNRYFEEEILNIQALDSDNYVCIGYFFKNEDATAFGSYIFINDNLEIQKELFFETKAKYDEVITVSSLINNQNQVITVHAVHSMPLYLSYYSVLNNKGEFVFNTFNKVEKIPNYTTSLIENYDKTGYYNFITHYVYGFDLLFNKNDSFNIKRVTEYPDDWFDFYYHAKWSDSNIFIGGMNSVDDKSNMSLAKFDKNFGFIKQHQLTSDNNIDYQSLFKCFDSKGNHYYLSGTSDFRFGPTYSAYKSGIRLANFDSDLNLKWDKVYGDSAYHFSHYTLATQDGGCLLAGHRYDFTQPERRLDLYLLKVDSLGNYTPLSIAPEKSVANSITLYPNPGTSQLNISYSGKVNGAVFTLYALSGTRVLSQAVETEQSSFATDHLPSGMYVYELRKNGEVVQRGKWVKQ